MLEARRKGHQREIAHAHEIGVAVPRPPVVEVRAAQLGSGPHDPVAAHAHVLHAEAPLGVVHEVPHGILIGEELHGGHHRHEDGQHQLRYRESREEGHRSVSPKVAAAPPVTAVLVLLAKLEGGQESQGPDDEGGYNADLEHDHQHAEGRPLRQHLPVSLGVVGADGDAQGGTKEEVQALRKRHQVDYKKLQRHNDNGDEEGEEQQWHIEDPRQEARVAVLAGLEGVPDKVTSIVLHAADRLGNDRPVPRIQTLACPRLLRGDGLRGVGRGDVGTA
mmetsp:Transcript_18735/g.58887  ORF Transcript_18735/g.58887 Transcript_18735/m.58887 type:complete len:276 (-) Transcript_18735:458-1285(-)